MALSLGGDFSTLRAGIHHASLDEIWQTFVDGAPFRSEREVLHTAMSSWVSMIDSVIPGGTMWVNGGFVTLKTWAPPRDVDIAVHWPVRAVSTWGDRELEFLRSMVSDRDAGRKPMSGLVDAFAFSSESSEMMLYWKDLWTRVKGPDGFEVVGYRKGFVEVER